MDAIYAIHDDDSGKFNLGFPMNLNLLHYTLSVETIDIQELKELYENQGGQDQIGYNRRERETLIASNASEVQENRHLELFLKAVHENSKCSMTFLRLHHTEEVILNYSSPPPLKHNLDLLEKLVINLDYQDKEQAWDYLFEDEYPVEELPIAPWVKELPRLECFVLKQREVHPACNLLLPLQRVKWPNLTSINLHMVTTTAEDLLSFLNKFSSTLRSLVIREPLIRPSAMALVVQEMYRLDTKFEFLRPADCVFTEVYEPKDLDKAYEGSKKDFDKIRQAGGEVWEKLKERVIERGYDKLVLIP